MKRDGPTAPYGSLPIGTLADHARPVGSRGPAAAARLIDERLDDPVVAGRRRRRSAAFYVVGGGWRALARIRLAMTDTPLKVVHDYRLSAEEAITLGRSIAATRPTRSCKTVPGMPGRRQDTVRAAALLLERDGAAAGAGLRVVFSAFGLREGRICFCGSRLRAVGTGPAARGGARLRPDAFAPDRRSVRAMGRMDRARLVALDETSAAVAAATGCL